MTLTNEPEKDKHATPDSRLLTKKQSGNSKNVKTKKPAPN